MSDELGEWNKLVDPIVKKCRLAVMLEMNTTFNEDGASALADLLEQMAKRLDDYIETISAIETISTK
jgi:hypothetical protein